MNNNSILIVEDDKKLNQFLCEYMEIYFQTVHTAFDGEEALTLYKKHLPDVIFMDINIPKCNGLEVSKIIREKDSKTIIVVVSAYTEKEKLFQAIELQLLTYLVKPIESKKLEDTLLKIQQQLNKKDIIKINQFIEYDFNLNRLTNNHKEIVLTIHEKKFLNLLLSKKEKCISYEDISLTLCELKNFSKNSISSLVKRLRKKIGDDVIINCFKEGYKIKTNQ